MGPIEYMGLGFICAGIFYICATLEKILQELKK
jgi:hypothetical protein